MIHNQNLKVVGHTTGPLVVGSTATTTLTIDRRGYDQVSVMVMKAGVSGATSFASVLKVAESDDNSSYADVAALVKDGVGGFTVPAVSTALSSVVKMDIDCLARKRYLRVTVTPDATAAVSVVGLMSRGENYPSTDAEVGVDKVVKV
jgi:hypothetical protein